MRGIYIAVVCASVVFLPPKILPADEALLSPDVLKAAIQKAIPLMEAGSRGSADQRKCFTCHNQAIPVMALAEVRRRNIAIDEANFQRQVQHTLAHLESGKASYLAGTGQGGKIISAGYALWTLDAADHKPDETTAAVTHFLLEYQKDKSHWDHPGSRPPTSGSDFTTSYVALRGLEHFGTAEQQPSVDARKQHVRQWLQTAAPSDTEDRVFRLWLLPYLDVSDADLTKASEELIALQQPDGGWAQLTTHTSAVVGEPPEPAAEFNSDAYATGTVLVALLQPGKVSVDRPAVQRGLRYLLNTQQADGSWYVVTRAKPFQAYYESGFPHGKDQFLSIAASSWATMALALALPETP